MIMGAGGGGSGGIEVRSETDWSEGTCNVAEVGGGLFVETSDPSGCVAEVEESVVSGSFGAEVEQGVFGGRIASELVR